MNYDCVIAGSGPSACACAMVLNEAGLSVCVVSPKGARKSEFTVGESLPGAALPLLNRIGLNSLSDILEPDQFSRCTGNASAWGSEHWHKMDAIQNPQGGGWHLDRNAFDNALSKKAQALDVIFIEGKVTQAKYQSSWYLELEAARAPITAKYLIDGTGRASALSKLIGLRKKHLDQQMAVVGWFESDKNDREQLTRIKAVEDGWWYSARLPSKTKKGLPIRVIAKFALPEICKSLFNKTSFIHELNDCGLLPINLTAQQSITDLQIKDAGVSKLTSSCDLNQNFIAIGDAVLSFDPLSSQGMFFALYSGVKAAEAIIKKHAQHHVSFAEYDKDIESIFKANQKSRALYYTSEHRFGDNLFWQTRVRS